MTLSSRFPVYLAGEETSCPRWWIGKDTVVNHHKEVPFRLLKPIDRFSVRDESGNLLVQGGNLEGRPQHSFWLQTSTDRFYPVFVCELTDDRFLVVEYKGFDRWSDDDAREKRNVGRVWEEKSEGNCMFVMPQGPDWNAILAKLGE